MNRRSAFTIVELLLVVAIIAALISIVIYSMRPAREAATRTKTLNGLRQMVAGYVGYATDNRAILLPGYCDFEGPAPRLESGESLEAKDKISYVWRLAPYLDHHWRTVMVDYHNDSLMERFEREYRNGQYGEHSITPDENSEDMGIATMPSIGLNSLFLGS